MQISCLPDIEYLTFQKRNAISSTRGKSKTISPPQPIGVVVVVSTLKRGRLLLKFMEVNFLPGSLMDLSDSLTSDYLKLSLKPEVFEGMHVKP
ncbi:uncharacterized protein [Spinacia oleracea]|uniref:Uncharacterized protein isoform X1 n=1 Tax=Spinacia oleracea TaxID=3562 RepID=A0ABM3R720_SPIOL|nr:uncharacterized protein LOC130466869 isoform X1 [Spinacia oleracea]